MGKCIGCPKKSKESIILCKANFNQKNTKSEFFTINGNLLLIKAKINEEDFIITDVHEDSKHDGVDKINIVVYGDKGVGKSSIAIRYTKGIYEKYYITSIYTEKFSKFIAFKNKKYKINFYVTAGDPLYITDTLEYSKIADIIMYIFDYSNKVSFESISHKIKNNFNYSKNIAIIGNKLDLKRDVNIADVNRLCKEVTCELLEVSTKTFANFDTLLEKLIFLSLEKKKKSGFTI